MMLWHIHNIALSGRLADELQRLQKEVVMA
jgi:hypothetical protein